MSARKLRRNRKFDRLLFLPPDLYTRNRIISSIIVRLKKHFHLRRLRILDVGGRGGQIREFLCSSEELLILDLRPPVTQGENYFLGDIMRAPFQDGKFHIVVASDTLEHIEARSRERFLKELLRMASHCVILGAPFHSPEVVRAESLVNKFHLALRGEEHPWLREHIEKGLPDERRLVAYLKSRNMHFRRITTNRIENWLLMQSFSLAASHNEVQKRRVESVFHFYNRYCNELGDGIEPTYRKIYIISRKLRIPQSLSSDSKIDLVKLEELLHGMFDAMAVKRAFYPRSTVTKLLHLYRAREDLQRAFPEAASGDLEKLIVWAANTALGIHKDGDSAKLRPYAWWYVWKKYSQEAERLNNELSLKTKELATQTREAQAAREQLRRIEDERRRLSNELSLKTKELATQTREAQAVKSQITRLADQLLAIKDQLRKLEDERLALEGELLLNREELARHVDEEKTLRNRLDMLAAISSERDAFNSQLKHMQAELNGIKRSFGYKMMRFYGSRIDRFLPDGTRRGELKRVIVQSFRIAASEGIRSFLRQAFEKVKRREFRIAEAIPDIRIKKQPTIRLEEDRRMDVTSLPKTQVLLHCDRPTLSKIQPIKLSKWIIMEGWAVSDKGIREVNVYLDDAPLGPASYGISRPDIGRTFSQFPGSHLSGFRKMIFAGDNLGDGPHVIRIVAESMDHSSNLVEGVVEFEKDTHVKSITAICGEKEKEKPIEASLSVVILTKSPPIDFEQTLERISSQNVTDVEIVMINSGGKDLGHLSKKYRAKVYNISPRDFDHGDTRNYGAELAKGDYVFFMTDDAIPANNHLMSDMIKALGSDGRVAAVTARQIPRTDADLMACMSIWAYYQALGLDRDRVVSTNELDKLKPEERRRLCQIDDVCSCFRRDFFLRHRYSAGRAYAEDLELGIKMVKEGYKIAQLFSNGVIHSHNRSPFYYLRRTYVEVKTLSELLEYDSRQFSRIDSLSDLLNFILDLYDRVCLTVDELRDHAFYEGNISRIFLRIRNRLTTHSLSSSTLRSGNQDLSKALSRISGIAQHVRCCELGSNPLNREYLASLIVFERWLLSTHQDLRGKEDDFSETLYKLLGVEIGARLGWYYVSKSSRLDSRLSNALAQIDGFLSEDV